MTSLSSSGAVGLRKLIGDVCAASISVQEFCDRFERVYNLEIDKDALAPFEFSAFQALFDVVVWYSPYPEEREQIPNYIGEHEVLAAVAVAETALGVSDRE